MLIKWYQIIIASFAVKYNLSLFCMHSYMGSFLRKRLFIFSLDYGTYVDIYGIYHPSVHHMFHHVFVGLINDDIYDLHNIGVVDRS